MTGRSLEGRVDADLLIDRVLDDEGLTAGLAEADATLLIRAATDRVRAVAAHTEDPATAKRKVDELCRQARQMAAKATADPQPTAALRRLLADWPAD
jgi:hypothetical protein